MAKYVLACACGRQIEVEPGQAGDSIVCDCGATVAVPTLRRLRELPPAGETASAKTSAAPAWGIRQGAITVSLLLASACLVLAAASKFSEKPVPQINPVALTQSIEHEVNNMAPVVAWQFWFDEYESLAATGFKEFKHPQAAAMEQDLNWHRWIQTTLLGVAAVCGVAAGVLAFTKTGT